ncbi:tetraacyldisaccharide 4'-kinase, partial [Fulvivirga sp. RKSG066]|uniref:tetraacyldisaccharide 4'-kinase n=1 Tax=Fulvivirga aurantia TaxID=2529383 RepID=UPI0012BD0580
MKFLGIVLYPFTLIYDLVTRFRNYLYDIDYKKQFEFDTCVIAVGNLSVGGTGKTPMIEYIIRLLKDKYTITTLSRGYGRKTKGFKMAKVSDSHLTIGDEPKQFYEKFGEISVAVGEERAVAIPFILAENPETNLILLDDAYQHRSVKPQLNILLTDFNRPFFNDYVLPSGRLREARKGANRADIIVVTKCDESLTDDKKNEYRTAISKYSEAPVFFTTVKYLDPLPVNESTSLSNNVFLFTGIARHESVSSRIGKAYNLVGEMRFPDHHNYTEADIDKLVNEFDKVSLSDKCLLTTEKDMVKFLSSPLKEKIS